MPAKTMLITGGAGFIGANAACHYAGRGWRVVVLDNLSRPGTALNLAWLRETAPRVEFEKADVRDAGLVADIVRQVAPEVVLHMAGQVAVTTSVADPRADFEVNALGTFNVLEAVRCRAPEALFVNASTNKVYGRMDNLEIAERNSHYTYARLPSGVPETQGLDFHSPYGCSKGAADQYTIDYARIFGLRTTSFRQSCIYGPRQLGVEDQGWVAWFAIATVTGRPVTIYGDGKQVRDVLHVDDLLRAYDMAIDAPQAVTGRAFNVGGGPENRLSLLELLDVLEAETGARPRIERADWRPGDQRVFVSDIGQIREALGWAPEIGVREGVRDLVAWVRDNAALFAETRHAGHMRVGTAEVIGGG